MKWVLFGFLIFLTQERLTSQIITQASSTTGLSTGLEIGSFSWISDDLDFDKYLNGLGIRAHVRYGINEFLNTGINYLQSFRIEDYSGGKDFTVSSFQFEVRSNLLGTNVQWRPTLAAHLNYSSANPELVILSTGELGISNIKGFGIGFEGGVNYFINPKTALSFSAGYTSGNYTNVVVAGQELTEDLAFSMLYFALGIRYQLVDN